MADTGEVLYVLTRMQPSGGGPLGTAFALGGKRIATCLHVIEGDDRGLNVIMPRDRFDGYQDTTNSEYFIQPVEIEAVDPIHDLAVLRFAEPSTSADVSHKLGTTDEVAAGDSVTILGYPHLDDNRVVLTQDTTTIGARALLGNKGIPSKHLVLNTLLRPGQSGGPVLHHKTQTIVAVLVGSHRQTGPGLIIQGIDPTSLNQTAHAVSAEYLQAML